MKYIWNPTDEQLSAFLGEVDCMTVLKFSELAGGFLLATVECYEPVSDYGCIWGHDWPELGHD